MILTPVFRFTVFASRGVDPTETTVLTPIAGAGHADPLVVATASGIAGAQGYLGFPKGTRGGIDPVTKKRTSGTMTVVIQDQRLGTGNAARWFTSFLGDEKKKSRLKGLKARLERSLDGGVTFQPYFTGRIRQVTLANACEYRITLRDFTEELNRPIFLSAPHPAIGYAFRASVMPVGMPRDWAGIPATPRLTGVMQAGYIQIDASVDPWLSVVTKVFQDVRTGPDGLQLVITDLVTGLTDAYAFTSGGLSDQWSVAYSQLQGAVTHARLTLLSGTIAPVGLRGTPAPPNGHGIAFYFTAPGAPTTTVPLAIAGVHPVQWMADIADGYFSVPAGTTALRAIAERDTSSGGPWAAMLADPSWPLLDAFVTSSLKPAEVFEQYLGPLGLGYDFDGAGRLVPLDCRLSANAVPAALVVEADLVASVDPEWDDTRDASVLGVELKYTQDHAIARADLEASQDQYPDVPSTMVRSTANSVLVVAEDLASLRDGSNRLLTFDCKGVRILEGATDAATGRLESDVVIAQLAAMGQNLLALSATGISGRLTLRATSAPAQLLADDGVTPALRGGAVFAYQVDKMPDPATNLRGGPRLAMCTSRDDQNERVLIGLVDLGAAATAAQPALGNAAVAGDDPMAIDIAGTQNAAGDAIEYWVAVTDTTVTVLPDERSPRWHLAATGGTGVTRLPNLPRGQRVWIRALSRAPLSRLTLPSAWAYLTAGYVDLPAISAASGLTVSNVYANSADLAWALGDTTQPVEIYVTPGAVPAQWTDAMRVAVLPPGAKTTKLQQLSASTAYACAVLMRDAQGGISAFATATFATSAVLAVAPRPAGLGLAVPGNDLKPTGYLTSPLTRRPAQTSGVLLAFYPSDASFGYELQRAPDLAGAPNAGAAVTVSSNIPGTAATFVDPRPFDATPWWYRLRCVGQGASPSPWTGWVQAFARLLPSVITRPPATAATVTTSKSSTSTTASLFLAVIDPQVRVTAVEARTSAAGGAWSAWAPVALSVANIGTVTAALAAGLGASIEYRVTGYDVDGVSKYIAGEVIVFAPTEQSGFRIPVAGATDGNGNVDLAGAGWVNRNGENLARSSVDSTPVSTVVGKLANTGHAKSDFSVANAAGVVFGANRHLDQKVAQHAISTAFSAGFDNPPRIVAFPQIVIGPTALNQVHDIRAIAVTATTFTPRAVWSTGGSSTPKVNYFAASLGGATNPSGISLAANNAAAYAALTNANTVLTTYNVKYDVDTTACAPGTTLTVTAYKYDGTTYTAVGSASYADGQTYTGEIISFSDTLSSAYTIRLLITYTFPGGPHPNGSVLAREVDFNQVTAPSDTPMTPSAGQGVLFQSTEAV